MITIADIAKQAGVTQATVSRVLSGKGKAQRISAQTQERVRTLANEMNYIPSFAARSLVRGKTNSIGFICGDIVNPYFNELANITMGQLERLGYHMLLATTQWKTTQNDLECLDTLLSRGVDGIIFFGVALQPETKQYQHIMKAKIPLVSINTVVPGMVSILTDYQPGVNEAIAYLKEMGHRRIIYVNGPHGEKEAAIRNAIRHYGLQSECRRVEVGWPKDWQEVFYSEGARVNRTDGLPDTFILGSDFIAQPFICGLHSQKIKVPEDVSVISFDGTKAGEFFIPPITSIASPNVEKMTLAIDIILELMEKKEILDQVIPMPSHLLIRKSVGKINNP
jgi:DNA-binding LacI/PurR family transcriptional regulator